MRHAAPFLMLAALLGAAPAHAVRPAYTTFDAAYLQNDSDVSEATGPYLALDISLHRAVYFTSEFTQRDFDQSEAVSRSYSLGLGVHTLGNGPQLFLAPSYERADVKNEVLGSRVRFNDEGYGVIGGVRWPLGPFEVQGDYKYLNFGDSPGGGSDDDGRIRIAALWHATPGFALRAGYQTYTENDDVTEWTAGVRFYIANQYDRPRTRPAPAPAPAQ